MKPRELRPVKVTKMDTCITYAFKRIGYMNPKTVCSSDLLIKYKSLPFTIESLPAKGSIVIWNCNSKEISIPSEITREGVVINHTSLTGFHVGVIEDCDSTVVSDLTRTVLPNGIPCIRVRKIEDIRKPDLILVI
jgi:hypothetical protein